MSMISRSSKAVEAVLHWIKTGDLPEAADWREHCEKQEREIKRLTEECAKWKRCAERLSTGQEPDAPIHHSEYVNELVMEVERLKTQIAKMTMIRRTG